MTAALYAKANGTQGALLVNGSEVVVFDSTGITSGVNKSSVSQMPALSTAVNTTSGTSIDFTGIPSWVKRITLTLTGVSTNGTANYLVQMGSASGGVESSGYLGATALGGGAINSTAGVVFNPASAAALMNGAITFTLMNASTNLWAISGNVGRSDTAQVFVTGFSKALTSTLDRIRLTTVGATDTFDAGIANILYE